MTLSGRHPPRWHITHYNDSDPNCEETFAALRIYSYALSPIEIGQHLHITPSDTNWSAVDRVKSTGAMQPPNLWELSSESNVNSKDLRRHLDWLLSQVLPASEALRGLQSEPDVKMCVHCRWWSKLGGGGTTLWPEQMKAIADLNLELSVAFSDYSSTEIKNTVT